jgi:exopolysaccharide biosynthesis polyprenyl glycosylphosphotransferase
MITTRRSALFTLFKLSDAGIGLASFVFASWIMDAPTRHTPSVNIIGFPTPGNVSGMAVLAVFWLWLFHQCGLYSARRLGRQHLEWRALLTAITLGSVVLALGGSLMSAGTLPVGVVGIFWLTCLLLTLAFRGVLYSALKRMRLAGRNLRAVLIAGTNQRGYDYARRLKEQPELGYRVYGYLDDKVWLPADQVRLVGGLHDLPTLLNTHVIDEVVIALPIRSYYAEIQQLVEQAEEQGVTIRYLFEPFTTKIAQSSAGLVNNLPVLTMACRSQDDWRLVAKRALDIVLASVLLVLTGPVILLAALAIKLTSRGPALFVQERIGYHKRPFRLYKLRTMIVNAEQHQQQLEALNERSGPVFKIIADPRITPVGRWLRKTSIDELPQLLNVLKGDMSLVGPRPLPLRDYRGFSQDWHRRRFSVLPSLTCSWQVTNRGNASFDEWMRLDMEYTDHWTLTGDLKILLRTIPAVLKGNGAS